MLRAVQRFALRLRIRRDVHGQDLIEYSLLAGLLATTSAAVLPELSDSIQSIILKVNRALTARIHHDDR